MQARYLAVLLFLGALWGAAFLFIKIGVREMAPEILVSIRMAVGALVLLIALYARGLRMPSQLRVWGDMLFVGVIGTVLPFLFITWSEQHITSGMASILNATTPLFSVVLTYVWTREERLIGLKLFGVAVGFAGVLVAVGIAHLDMSSNRTLGVIAMLLATFCYALIGIYARRAFRGLPALVPATGQLLTGAIVLTPFALALHGIPSPLPSYGAVSAVLALAVLCTAATYIIFYWLLERIGATRTAMVAYLMPPFALIYGALFLQEQITIDALLGLGLVVFGVLLSSGLIRSTTIAVKSEGLKAKGES